MALPAPLDEESLAKLASAEPVIVEAAPRLTLRPTSAGKLVGRSAQLVDILATIDRIARSACTVLVTGESGTGKEVVASAIHDASPRATRSLVVVNCGAIPAELLESELFGHAKGAFTGAHAARQGRVAAAERGTLFLDEIGDLPLALQVKLLRLLQQREYSPVGDDRTIKCDIRIVAATNRDLEAEVKAGRFREDLFYRLNVIHLHLPPLRERRDDIPLLAKHFLRKWAERNERPDIQGFAPEAIELMHDHDWPGNVRMMENAIERSVLLAQGPFVGIEDLFPRTSRSGERAEKPAELPAEGIDFKVAVEQFESQLLRQALERTNWNKQRAADLLNMNRTTLVEMVKRKKL